MQIIKLGESFFLLLLFSVTAASKYVISPNGTPIKQIEDK